MPTGTEAGTGISPSVRRYAIVVLAVVYMFNFVDRQILAILLPAIREEFQVGDTLLGLLSGTAFAVFYVTLGVPVARLADRVNRRNLIALSLAVWSGMTALCGLAANAGQLALARVGVGIGEAGCSPPAHSMIADLYPPGERSTAMGIYTIGAPAGIMLAYLAGGWVVANIGWREALFIVGLPGLLLALLVRVTLPEPLRGSSEARFDSGRRPRIAEVLDFLVARRSFVFMALAAGLSALSGYSISYFMPSFMVRSFGIDMATLGVWLGLIYGLAGGLGFFGGGWVADRIGRRGHRRALQFIAVAVLATALLNAAVFLSTGVLVCLLLFVAPTVTSNVYLAPVLSQAQSLASLRMRATASAVMLLVINVIGLAVGPPLTGAISDSLAARFGEDSMRYSLLIVSSAALTAAAWCYGRAGRYIDADLGRAREHD